MDVLIGEIANVIGVFVFDDIEKADIKEILEDNDTDAYEKASAICDLLGIERRHNRGAIVGKIFKQNNTQLP